jgi:hypothetical protein
MIQTSAATSSSVGSSPMSRLSRSERPSVGGSALTSTFPFCSSADSWSLLANVGTSVSNSVVFPASPGGLTDRRNFPVIVSPRDAIDLTLPARTCSRKYGV